MNLGWNIFFFSFGGLIVILSLIFILQIGFIRFESRIGIARDEYPPGKVVPAWTLPDLNGQLRKSPSEDRWQLLIFVNYALGAFPELIVNIQQLASASSKLEVLILAGAKHDFCEAMARGLDLRVPVVSVDQSFYQRFRVRTMPFAFFLDPSGKVQWVGMAGSKALLVHVWHLLENTRLSSSKGV